jgi:hypothetical protein
MPDTQYLFDHTVAIFPTRDQAEGAIRFLENSGHEITHVSMIGKCPTDFHLALDDKTDTHDPILFVYPDGECIKFGGWMAEIPDKALLTSGEPAIGQALCSMGIPTQFADKYVDALERGSFIIFVHATSNELRRVKESLANTPATSVKSFSTRGAVKTFGVPLPCESHS